MSDDPYAVLGVAKTATQDEIKKAYRRIAKECHPDLKPDDATAEARFKAAVSAYDLLKDADKRARFDKGEIDASGQETPKQQYYREYSEAAGNPYRSGPGRGQGEYEDMSDIFSDFMRRQNAQQGLASRGSAGNHRGGARDFTRPARTGITP